MRRLADASGVIALTLWVGALWAIGYIAAPTLFANLSDRLIAGTLAGRMFSIVGWLGLGCGSYLLLFLLVRRGAVALRSLQFWIVLLMLLLTVVQLFGLQPLIAELRSEGAPGALVEAAARSRFTFWHGVASGLYLLQSLLGVVAVVGAPRGER